MANKAGQILSSENEATSMLPRPEPVVLAKRTRLAAIAIIASLFAATGLEHVQADPAVPTENVLYSFQGGSDGVDPLGSLIFDTSGALYGTTSFGGTSGFGTVFKLAPPHGPEKNWIKTVLYNFAGGTDGASPVPSSGLVFDTSGALYGMTTGGGTYGNGTVFRLSPPAAKGTAWTETVLYSFAGNIDGEAPHGGLIFDTEGALYGVTARGGTVSAGTVFKLTPQASGQTPWSKVVLYNFAAASPNDGEIPTGGLIFDSSGALYGTTSGGANSNIRGTVFKLTATDEAQTQWTETVLYYFAGGNDGIEPCCSLIFDGHGALYGTTAFGGTSSFGTVFKLTPPTEETQSLWTKTTCGPVFIESPNFLSAPPPVKPKRRLLVFECLRSCQTRQ